MIPQAFTPEQVRAARDLIVARTGDEAFTGSHFNHDDADAKLQLVSADGKCSFESDAEAAGRHDLRRHVLRA